MGKSKIKPFIILGVILLIIGLVIGIYLYINTDFLKSSKTLFSKYFSQNLSLFDDYGNEASNHLNEFTDNTNYKEIGTLTLSIGENSNAYVIKTEYEKDVINEKGHSTISFNFKDNELLTGDFYHTNNIYGINVTNLTDKMVAVRNEELKSLAQNLGFDDSKIPNRINLEINEENVKISEELNSILNEYLINFDETFDKKLFKKDKNIDVKIDTENYKANKYTINTTVDAFYSFIKSQLEKAKTDDVLKQTMLNKFNVSNDLYLQFIDEGIKRIDDLLAKLDKNNEFLVKVYESNGKILKLEAGNNCLKYEFYVSNLDNLYKAYFNFENIDSNSGQKIESYKIVFENKYDNENQEMALAINSREKSAIELLGETEDYIDSSIVIKYSIRDIMEESASRNFSVMVNNKKLIDYKSKLIIGANVVIDNITSENAHILNDMQVQDVSNLISDINDNTEYFINTSRILENIQDEVEEISLADSGDIWSARRDLENAISKIIANYNLDNEGAASLKEYFDLSRLLQNLSLTDEISLSEDKNTISYRNRIGKNYEFGTVFGIDSISIQRMTEIIPEPEPEPEPEIIEEEPEIDQEIPELDEEQDEFITQEPNSDIIATMKTEINTYLAAVFEEALAREEGILVEDYINGEQIVNNCLSVYEAGVEEQEPGIYYIECRDEQGNLYSGIIRIYEHSIVLTTFN